MATSVTDADLQPDGAPWFFDSSIDTDGYFV
jgi:hypothetical protein